MEANRNEKPRGEYEPWRLTEGRQGAGGMIGWAHRKVNELLADARDVMRGRESGVEEEDHCTDEANKQRGQEPMPARRSFPVPDGLAPLLVRLWDESRTSIRAEFRLWKILADRCPETSQGRWKLVHLGAGRLEVREIEEPTRPEPVFMGASHCKQMAEGVRDTW